MVPESIRPYGRPCGVVRYHTRVALAAKVAALDHERPTGAILSRQRRETMGRTTGNVTASALRLGGVTVRENR